MESGIFISSFLSSFCLPFSLSSFLSFFHYLFFSLFHYFFLSSFFFLSFFFLSSFMPGESAAIRRRGNAERRRYFRILPHRRADAGSVKTRVPPAWRRARAPMRTLGDGHLRRHLCDSAPRPIFRSCRPIGNAGRWHRPGRWGRSIAQQEGRLSSAIPGPPAGPGNFHDLRFS